ncbi:MAG: hypothetical protein ACXABO_11300 [Promethearchaeota archaeon]
MVHPPDLDELKKLSDMDDPIEITQIFTYLLNELKASLNLELINKKVKIYVVDETDERKDTKTRLPSYGVHRYIKDDTYHLNLFKNYRKFFPFLLLQCAYLNFIPNNLKENDLINFAINQFVEIDLQEFTSVTEWSLFVRERFLNYNFLLNQSDKFRFDKFLELQPTTGSESPRHFFFEYIRQNPNLNFDENLQFYFNKMFEDFMFKSSKNLQNNEIIETLRILVKIFYKVKNCDTLEGFYNHFDSFKKHGVIQTELSLRSFRKNLRWINKYSFITPSYYFDWKALNMAVITCHLQFNPLLEKAKIDKIIDHMPFLIMPELSITNFSVELSAYFVIPKIYIKDLIYMLENMERYGYIFKKHCAIANKYVFSLNLNYFREYYKNGQIINTSNKKYSKDFEIEFVQNYNKDFNKPNLTLLDFLILERIRFFSFVGINFSRKREITKIIKSDYSHFFLGEINLVEELESILKHIYDSPELQNSLLNFLERNEKFGFFYVKDELEKWENHFNLIEKGLNDTDRIKNFNQFKEFVEKENILKSIEESSIFDQIDSNSFAFKNLFLNYLNSRDTYTEEVEKLRNFYKFIKLCSNLKIFSIKSIKKLIKEPELLDKITKLKRVRLKELKKKNKIYDISYTTINFKIDEFINKTPKIIKPYLIATIWTNSVARYFPQLILKNTPEVKTAINIVTKYFPKSYFYESTDLFSNQDYVFLQIFIPHLSNNEKIAFISVMSKIFKENIVSFKRYGWDGFLHTFTRRDFYDFNKMEFFYTKDLFEQFFLSIRSICGEDLKHFKEKPVETFRPWSINENMGSLIKKINNRINSEYISFNPIDNQKLMHFHLNLKKNITATEELLTIKKENFFSQYLKSIKILPAFQKFGLGQYFLYITPFEIEDVELKILFTNTFQTIKHLASIDSYISLLIKYIFPYNKPNTSYLNWLRSKNKIREYCLFTVKSMSQILHFNYNLTSNGWYLDSNNFNNYVQNILFNPNYKVQTSEVKDFDIGESLTSDYYKPDSPEFKALLHLYNWHSIDIKKYTNNNSKSIFNEVQALIKKKLIFPYITLKNLDFKEIINFILINPKKETFEILKYIFRFFNLGFVYDIEGEYYIHGFEGKKKIYNGLMVKLYLPDCELAEFLRIFEYVFQFLKVEKYLILIDLVKGDSLIRSVYGNIDFLKKYNPLENLIWNAKAKNWINHKLFDKNFDYLYPNLNFK